MSYTKETFSIWEVKDGNRTRLYESESEKECNKTYKQLLEDEPTRPILIEYKLVTKSVIEINKGGL